ncbi:MAG: ATP-binding protein [Paludibacteraceae bacterium]|nr:ATP-binding protein [Paludibacteraceae bacterium]
MFKRQQASVLQSRIGEPRRFIQVIAGARQVGKSTMVKQVVNELTIPHLLTTAEEAPDKNPQWIRYVWQQARQAMRLNNYAEFLLVIDEIHKLDNWSEVVKAEWDADSMRDVNIKVVLLGSSRLLIKDGLNESLAGRYELIEMEHWSYNEMREAFGMTIDQYVYYGGYPGAFSLIDDEKRWRKYMHDAIIEPAITKDVLTTKRVLKPALLRQLFLLGCSYSGELLSFNKILGQLQDAGNTATLANYLQLLDESKLLAGLQQFAADDARKYKSVPKYQVYNSGLLSATNSLNFNDVYLDPQQWGRWVETAVGAYLINHADRLEYKLYFWRHDGNEVDFILQSSKKLVAIEVKSGRRQNNQGLPMFSEQFHPDVELVVGGEAFSLEQFLTLNIEQLFD